MGWKTNSRAFALFSNSQEKFESKSNLHLTQSSKVWVIGSKCFVENLIQSTRSMIILSWVNDIATIWICGASCFHFLPTQCLGQWFSNFLPSGNPSQFASSAHPLPHSSHRILTCSRGFWDMIGMHALFVWGTGPSLLGLTVTLCKPSAHARGVCQPSLKP